MTARVEREIVVPTLAALSDDGCPFTGCLYVGLMLTSDGPKVVEFNCRFGDPETQAVLALLDSDLLTALRATTDHSLATTPITFRDGAACCVVLASGGYPGLYHKGYSIDGLEDAAAQAELDFAGVTDIHDELVTSGGRVVGVTAIGPDLAQAIDRAYRAADKIHFKDAHCRRDIGRAALTLIGE